VPPESPAGDDQLQIDLRLGLDEVAAAEEERLRRIPRRRPTRRELSTLALRLYDARRGRDRLFEDGLFGEPGWDMLLALYEQGLIERGPQVRDSRQQLLRLTNKGRMMMERYLIRLFFCEGADAADDE
jgi:hypothetical protein